MQNIFRSLSFTITQLVYPLISYLYDIFERIAKHQFFSDSDIENLSQNIYIIISACMLFTLGLKLLSAIVNPDALDGGSGDSSSKGTKRTAKNIFFSILLSLFLIVAIPMGFDLLYKVQDNILKDSLVEKIILGADVSEEHAPGQILASYSFASFCHPQETVSVKSIANDGGNLYNLAITENIEYIRDMDDVINSKTDGEYDIEYHAILSPAVGLFLTYEMILICIDIALRSIKLGLLELITSVVLCGYVVSGTDLLKRWAKEVMSTYLVVFLKIAAMSFMVFGLSLLEDFLDRLNDEQELGFWSRGLLRVFVIIGLLQLVRQIPDLINKIFGTNIKPRGGIRGRLGEMAAVGDIAQRAWDQLRTHPLQTGQRLLSAPVSAIGGAASHIGASIQKGRDLRNQMEENHATRAKSNFAMMRTIAGGMVGSFGAMFRAGHSGWQNGNIQGIGGAYRNYKENHPTDMLEERANRGFLQSLNPANSDRLRTMVGAPTRYESQQERDKYVDYNGKKMTVDQLNNMKNEQTAITQQRNAIRDAAVDAITADDSNLQMDVAGLGHGNYQQLVHQLERLRGEQLHQHSGESDTAFAARQAAHDQHLIDLENNLIQSRNETRDAIIEYATSNGGDFSGLKKGEVVNWTDSHGETHNVTLNTVNGKVDGIISGRDMGIMETSINTMLEMGLNVNSNEALNTINNAAQNAINDIDTHLISHQQGVYNRQNTVEGRAMEQSHEVVRNHQSNQGGNNHGGNNG